MGKKTAIWLIAAACLILVGCILWGGAMQIFRWDFTKLSTVKYQTNNYKIHENYTNITIVTDTADIALVLSENSQSSVVCYEQQNAAHLVSVKDDTLVIEIADARKWYEYIGFNLDNPKITVFVPQGELGALSIKSSTGDVEIPKGFAFESIDITESTGNVTNHASASEAIHIKTSTGDIHVENVSSDAIDLSVSTGKVTVSSVICQGDLKIHVSTGKTNITDIKCKNFASGGGTGSITMQNVIAAEKLSIERSTGDVRFEMCDAAEILVNTSTGDVKGSLLTDKVFITQTDTGNVNVPKTTAGGRCEINTDTGDIRISIS